MFGGMCFGEVPIAAALEFRARASMPLTVRASAVYRLLYASQQYTSLPTDSAPNTPFDGRLLQGIRFDRSLTGDRFTQVSRSIGELSIVNTDRELDSLLENYTIDGCRIVLWALRGLDASYDDRVVIFDGTAQDWKASGDAILITTRDNEYLLDVPAQPNVYGGTGGTDGGADLKGKRKPRAFGDLSDATKNGNITPPLVIPASLLYQPNDGQMEAVTAVYDDGIALSAAGTADYATSTLLLAATTGAASSGADIEAGEYATCLAEGYIRLGGAAAGIITCDVKGDKLAGTYVNTTGTICRRLVSSATSMIDPDDLDTTSFANLETAQPAVIGYYLDENSSMTVRQTLDELLGPIGAFATFRRGDGVLQVGILLAPSGTPTARYEQTDMVAIPRRDDLPNGLTPMPWRFRMEHSRNWTIQQLVDGTVTAARLSYLAQAARVVTSSDTAASARIQAAHLLAQDPAPIKGFFRDSADAQIEVDRLLTLFGATRALYRFTLKLGPLIHTLGEVIHVTYPMFDLADGKLLRIVGLSEDTTKNQVEVAAFG